MIPRGIRNNNPGNIIQSGIAWQGKLAKPDDPRFEQFDTAQNGIRALAKLVISYQDKHGLRTVRGIINRWAPPVENDTGAYVAAVANAVGVKPDDTIEVHRTATLAALTTAIIRHENGQQPYPATMIAAAVASALGVAVDSAPPKLTQRKDAPMGAGLIIGLVQALIQGFAPKAAQVVGGALEKHGFESDVGQNIVKTIADAVAPGILTAPPLEQMAAFTAASKDATIMTKAETSAVDYVAAVTPLLDKAAAYEAAARQDTRGDANDSVIRKNPALLSQRALAWMIFGAMLLVGLAMILSMAMMWYQVFRATDGKVDAFVASLATMAFMAITSMAQAPFRSIFGNMFDSQAAGTARGIAETAATR